MVEGDGLLHPGQRVEAQLARKKRGEPVKRRPLKGARPEQAFRVRCDATTNLEEERDLGRVLCEIDLAPAVPMEFITLRVALSASGTLDVFEK